MLRAEEPEESVPLPVVIQASIEIYREWELVEDHADELPPAERAAYQEGVLRALSILNARTGVSIETMDEDARSDLGAQKSSDAGLSVSADSGNNSDECAECGRPLIMEMGRADAFCPDCDG